MRQPPSPLEAGTVPLAEPGQSFVYRIYDNADDLLYVGVTDDICKRIAEHRSPSDWRHRIARITWERYASRAEAERVERHYIETLIPEYNIRDNGRRVLAAQMGHRRPYPGEAWKLLGAALRVRRSGQRRTQTNTAAAAGITLANYRALERGESAKHERVHLERVEAVMNWQPGSLEAILAGGAPIPLRATELLERALAAHRVLSPGDRI